MADMDTIALANQCLAREINQEARHNPGSPYAGRFVGIANGKVVVVAGSWREVAAGLRQVEADPKKCWALEASADYDRLEEIWRAW